MQFISNIHRRAVRSGRFGGGNRKDTLWVAIKSAVGGGVCDKIEKHRNALRFVASRKNMMSDNKANSVRGTAKRYNND